MGRGKKCSTIILALNMYMNAMTIDKSEELDTRRGEFYQSSVA